jgi:predicted aspartyl protease
VIFKFDPTKQLIVVKARIIGPKSDLTIDLALDTGASSTLIGWEALRFIGFAVHDASSHVEMTTGSGTEVAPKIKLDQMRALGKRRHGLEVVAHTLPSNASVDGLLGLDFFSKSRLTTDFRKFLVKLS